MNMKKMRGAVDPITLGFVIAASIAAMGTHTSMTTQQAAQQEVQAQQAVRQTVKVCPVTATIGQRGLGCPGNRPAVNIQNAE